MLAVRTTIATAVLAVINTYGSGTVLGTERMLVNGEGAHGSTSIIDASSNRWAMTQYGVSGTDLVTVQSVGSTWTNTTQPSPARGTGAMYFNMATSVYSPKSSLLYPSSSADWTYDLFVMIPTGGLSANGVLFGSAGGNLGNWTDFNMVMYQMANGRYQFEWGNGTGASNSGVIGSVLNTNIWRHYAVVYTGSTKTLQVYVDGVLDATVDMSTYAASAATPRVTLGRYDPTLGTSLYFKGYIDRFRFTSGKRWTSAFVPDDDVILDSNLSSVTLGLHCNGTNGASIVTTPSLLVDSSATAAVPSAAVGATLSTANKRMGSAALSLSSGYVRYAASIAGHNLTDGDFTVEGWFFLTAQNFQRLVQHQTGSGSNSQYTYGIQYMADGTIRGYVNGGNTIYPALGPVNPTLNAWNHIAFVRNGNNLTLFVNGVPGTTVVGPANGTINNLPTGRLTIGADLDNSNPTTGLIDEFRITKGVARYTTAFVPQWAPFSDNGLGVVLGTENFILAGDNPNTSTTITDSSTNSLTFTNSGVTNSTTRAARGTASLLLNNGYAVSDFTTKAYMGGASSWTFDCFLYMPALPSTYNELIFCSLGAGGWQNTHMFDITINSNGKLCMETCNGSTSPTNNVDINATALAINTWYHVAFVWDSVAKSMAVYVNGTSVATIAQPNFGSYNTAPRVTIGRTDPTVANPTYLSNMNLDRVRLTPSIRWTGNFTPD